ncbi:MAG: hypothetical protein HQL90_14330 [Magnetococcales bacterium]|nr:hypothetical protein [Magnetococcales bacterium]
MEMEQPIRVSLVKESIHVPLVDDQLMVAIHDERFDFSSPPVLASSGWPFGLNPVRVDGLQKGVATVVDYVVMPSFFRVVRWMLLLTDDSNDLAVTSTVQCLRRGGDVLFTEFAILGDYGVIPYELDVVVDGDKVKLVVTSGYDGVVTARTSKIGIFN